MLRNTFYLTPSKASTASFAYINKQNNTNIANPPLYYNKKIQLKIIYKILLQEKASDADNKG